MLFNSVEFLFFFLPLTWLGFLCLQQRGNYTAVIAWLLLCSLFFYAWWNPAYLALMLLSMFVNFLLGNRISKQQSNLARTLLILGLAFNLGLLAYFKYFNFFIDSMNTALGSGFNFEKIILPLAISFFTFQQITYLVDSYRNRTVEHNLLEYGLFVAFFPQLIAGPIVHHSEMLKQFKNFHEPCDNSRNVAIGLSIFSIGLFKKVVLADTFALFSTPVFELSLQQADLTSADALTGILCYALQLYFDFSGYSDMAIGLACLFGIKLPVNFLSPYRARNISEFWNTWHATLSRFLRDYVYRPLGGFACSPARQRLNLFLTMFAGGVWHGAGWTFIVYGICHGAYVVLHQVWRVKLSGPLGLVGRKFYTVAARCTTFIIVSCTLVLFRAENVDSAVRVYSSLLNGANGGLSPAYTGLVATNKFVYLVHAFVPAMSLPGIILALVAAGLLICWLLPNTFQLFTAQQVMLQLTRTDDKPVINFQWAANTRWSLIIAALLFTSMLHLNDVSEFLYFQF